MSDRWFRLYNTVRHDRKIRRLSDKAFRAWIMLLSVASEEGGIIPESFDDIAMELHVSAGNARELVQSLVSVGLLEHLADGQYRPHKWEERQFKSDTSTDRVKRFRKRERNVSETAPEQSITEQSITETDALPLFDVFYEAMPKKINRPASMVAYSKALKIAPPELLVDRARIYARSAGSFEDRYILSPAKWLDDKRWTDGSNGHATAFNSPEEIEGQRLARERAYGKAQ